MPFYAYLYAEDFEKYYDYIEVCRESEKVHYKQAIQVRNRCMVDRSDLTVFWVECEKGGAYMTMKYAEREQANMVNLVDKVGEER